jgi:hypothetical protein
MSDPLDGLDFELSNDTADQITLDYVNDLSNALTQARMLTAVADNSPLGQLQAQWLREQVAEGNQILEELSNG